ncbi:MAG: hypothetical protein ABR510_10695 [Trueperaceae bacterium]
MSELDRIEAMRAAGTISDAEADRLIEVLRDLGGVPATGGDRRDDDPSDRRSAANGSTRAAPVDPAPQASETGPAERADRDEARDELRRMARDAREQARAAARSAGADAADAVRGATEKVRESVEQLRGTWNAPDDGGSGTDAAHAASDAIAIAPDGTRWLRIALAAGDLDVQAADVDAPTLDEDADGRVRLEATADGARLFADPQRGFLGRYTPAEARVRVPRAWGIDLDVKAGDLDVRDVPFIAGNVLAGDVEVRGARGLDLTCLAGDVSIALAPTEGRHRLVVRAGDVSVRLLPGSDVSVEGRVSVGDASARGLERERRGLGAVVHGRIGSGRAQLAIELGAGDLEVRAEERPKERLEERER